MKGGTFSEDDLSAAAANIHNQERISSGPRIDADTAKYPFCLLISRDNLHAEPRCPLERFQQLRGVGSFARGAGGHYSDANRSVAFRHFGKFHHDVRGSSDRFWLKATRSMCALAQARDFAEAVQGFDT